ncbi:EF-hand domain-containing protein [Sphingobium sufflavum]|uniref:EF-hand domain-containing protein n=1 Tax=Sphingobium sufflavum TaxID=1129547 RepID=UPI001F3E6D8E|nr:EF-hand domain-containing protein [Sphingobium sufflavum]MCE7797474.1 EF-hand domain-containing protein [Sphingobium sufflavum]
MNHRLLSILAAGTLLAGGAAALAQSPVAPPPTRAGHPVLDALDSNKDGVITRAEFTAALDQRFAALDTDRNGIITPAERQAQRDTLRDQRLGARFAAIDSDKNGQISPAEFRAAHDRKYAPGKGGASGKDAGAPPPPPGGPRFGKGPDGGPDAGPHGEGRGDRDQGGHGRGGWGDHGGHGGHGARGWGKGPGGVFGDGFAGGRDGSVQGDISKADFVKRPLALFDRIDSNHDGKITAAERDAAGGLRGGWRGGFRGHHGGPAPEGRAPNTAPNKAPAK